MAVIIFPTLLACFKDPNKIETRPPPFGQSYIYHMSECPFYAFALMLHILLMTYFLGLIKMAAENDEPISDQEKVNNKQLTY